MMRSFYKKIVVFLLPVLLVWLGFELFYRTVPTNYTFKDAAIQQKYKELEVLIFGNSHAFYGIDPQYFDRPTFNIGNISQSLYFDELIFNKHIDSLSYLKAIILPISYFSLSQQENNFEDRWRKYFYDQQMDLNVPIVSNLDPKKYSLTLARRFNKSVDLLSEYIEDGTIINCYENGYGMQDGSDIVPDKERISFIIAKKHEDGLSDFSTNTERLRRIIQKCKTRDITVFLVEMPVYETYYKLLDFEKKSKIVSTCASLADEFENVVYIKLSRHAAFEAKDLRDADHLTNEGAKKCSLLLNTVIEETLAGD